MLTWMSILVWVVLSWNANSEPDLRTYRVYERCSEATVLDLAAPFFDYTEVGLVTTFRTEAEANRFYYFCVTAVNTSGLESEASNMIFVIYATHAVEAGTSVPATGGSGDGPSPIRGVPWLGWLEHLE